MNRDDEIESGENGGESGHKDAKPGGDDIAIRIRPAVRRVERPSGIHPANDDRGEADDSSEDVDIPAQQIDTRKSEVLGSNHQRYEKISQNRWNCGDQEENDH